MKKQFKAESKKLMDLMINSIYTNKDIFLREIISNASDAIDKLHYKSLTDKNIKVNKKDFEIRITIDKENRLLTISDNGIGMSKDELENNLGTIAKSGTLDFKNEIDSKKDLEIIGQFGVGFYSSFMVADSIKVISKKYGEKDAYCWESSGIDGYSINDAKKDNYGTDIILSIKENDDNFEYDKYLEEYDISHLVKKYSNYITYPIKMLTHHNHGEEVHEEDETLNDMIPIWKRNKNKITDEEYNTFYSDKFFDYNEPLKVIHTSAEGMVTYNSLIYIPSKAPYDFYTKDYEKGLQLYSNGVLIMERCKELVPDYFNFVKGVVDSPDLSLNISREILQQDKKLLTIAKNIETKINKELTDMMNEDREKYEEFFKVFGPNLKFGAYDQFGVNKDKLKDLLMFTSSKDKKLKTIKEYVANMEANQDSIYYVCGETVDKISALPVVEKFLEKGYEIFYCTDYMDEFVLQTIGVYDDKKFVNIATSDVDLSTDEEKEKVTKLNDELKDMLTLMKEELKDVKEVKLTNRIKNYPVCLSTVGNITIEMEKVINAMPNDEHISAEKVLEINSEHKIVDKLKELYKTDKESLKKYAKILYAEARLIEGLSIENPAELSNLITDELI